MGTSPRHFKEVSAKFDDVTGNKITITTGTVKGEASSLNIQSGTSSGMIANDTTATRMTISSGTISSSVSGIVIGTGTASLSDTGQLKAASGTGIGVDGYIEVWIGGTQGFIPVMTLKPA